VAADADRTRRRVDVDPNAARWQVQVQRRTANGWQDHRTVYTIVPDATVTVDVPRGTYRAVLPAQHGSWRHRRTAARTTARPA
jgi:hypothetical protein